MEKKKDEIEDLFKESFDGFEPEVEPKVWKNVKTAVKWGGVGVLIKYIVHKVGTNTIVAVVSSAVTVVSTLWVIDNKKDDSSVAGGEGDQERVVVETKSQEKEDTLPGDGLVQEKEKISSDRGIVTLPETKVYKEEQPRSFKNTTVTEVMDAKKVKSVINDLSTQSIAIISATPVSGSAPLIVNLTNVGTGVENKWIFSDGQSSTNEINPARAFLAGKHFVVLQSKSANGRIATDTVTIEVTEVSSMASPPNVFSPNGDGVADVFSFQSKNMVSMQAEIYDRSSNLIYKWKGTDGSWDGKNLKGEEAPAGIYFYIITAEGVDGKKYEQKAVIQLDR